MQLPKILIIPGSSRTGSHNTRLAASAHRVFSALDCEINRISLRDYPIPIYDGDVEKQRGAPENAIKLARMFDAHDGIMLLSPEYNGSLPSLLKNTLDWVSRVKADKNGQIEPYKSKIFAIGSASPGALGGIRGLSHLRDMLTSVGATVIAEQVAIGGAFNAFDEMDELLNERARELLGDVCISLVNTSRILSMR